MRLIRKHRQPAIINTERTLPVSGKLLKLRAGDVGYCGKSGNHLLAVSFSQLEPIADITIALANGRGLQNHLQTH
jgi:hypothetical protein